jgi:hypothetical protein
MKIITILTLALTLLSNQVFAEMRDLKIPRDSGNGCKMNVFAEYQKNKNRYCSLVVETCIINKDKTKAIGISRCDIDQNEAKAVYKSLRKQ